jgi:hypothetical protein
MFREMHLSMKKMKIYLFINSLKKLLKSYISNASLNEISRRAINHFMHNWIRQLKYLYSY